LFFDRAKKTLETREIYDEFLRLLGLYSKDIIDTKTLLENARLFLGNGDLLVEFKDLISWDDNQENVEYGPPGSIRTGPPEAMSAMPVDDGEGPSYRRLPPSVSCGISRMNKKGLTRKLTGNVIGVFWPRPTLSVSPQQRMGFSSNLGDRRSWIPGTQEEFIRGGIA
jgi:hypothetical protein